MSEKACVMLCCVVLCFSMLQLFYLFEFRIIKHYISQQQRFTVDVYLGGNTVDMMTAETAGASLGCRGSGD